MTSLQFDRVVHIGGQCIVDACVRVRVHVHIAMQASVFTTRCSNNRKGEQLPSSKQAERITWECLRC